MISSMDLKVVGSGVGQPAFCPESQSTPWFKASIMQLVKLNIPIPCR